MLNLVFPLDFERLAEFRLFASALSSEREAAYVYLRLFVELGYLAQVTNRPGYLTREGVTLFESSVVLADGHHESPVKSLINCRVLTPMENGEFYCERFARLNAHLSGNYKAGVDRGAAKSAVVRIQKQLEKETFFQAGLFPPEFYKRRDGSPMNDVESRQAVLLIKNLDRCLKLPPRQKWQFTEGLVTDAGEAAVKHGEAELIEFYSWLRSNRENPVVPKTTEKLLTEFDKFFDAAGVTQSKEQPMTVP